jgi:hypothetical protein
MQTRAWPFLAALLLLPAVVLADELIQEVRGRLVAVDPSNGARGEFRIESRRATSSSREGLWMSASRLGVRPDADGDAAEYRAVLLDSGGTLSADFGAARLDRSGRAFLRFDTRWDEYPAGVTTLRAFGGGTFELRREGSAVLRGAIPEFVELGEQGSAVSTAFFHGRSRLQATINGGSGRGDVDARAWSGRKRGEQRLRIGFRQVGTLGNPFTVVALDGAGGSTTLGEVVTRGRSGTGVLDLTGSDIPGGGILGLSGQSVEVRNSAGTVVLTGTFPTVP